MEVLNSLAPVFLLAAVGAWLRMSNFLPQAFFDAAGKLIYRIALPALLFLKISSASFTLEMGEALNVCLVLSAAMLLAVPLSYFTGKAIKLPARSMGAFIQASFRCSTAFVGLPVILYTLPDSSAGHIATLAIAPVIPLTNITATLVLLVTGENECKRKRTILTKAILNPLVLACMLGILFSALGLSLPLFAERSLSALGRTALPLALLGVGASVAVHSSLDLKREIPPLVASIINVILLPAAGYILCRLFQINQKETLIALIYLACPAATTSYALVQQMGGDARLAADSIIISTLLSAPVLVVILLFFG